MSEELKPCPFCKNEKLVIVDPGKYIYCEDCQSSSEDIYTWNNRPIEDELRKRIVEMEDEDIENSNAMQIYEPEIIKVQNARIAELEQSWHRDVDLAASRVNQLEEYNGKLTDAIDNYLNDTRGRPAVEALERAMKLYGYQDRVNQ